MGEMVDGWIVGIFGFLGVGWGGVGFVSALVMVIVVG